MVTLTTGWIGHAYADSVGRDLEASGVVGRWEDAERVHLGLDLEQQFCRPRGVCVICHMSYIIHHTSYIIHHTPYTIHTPMSTRRVLMHPV
jgi:hypothetical protein